MTKRVWINDSYHGSTHYPVNGSADRVLTCIREMLEAGFTLTEGIEAGDNGQDIRLEFTREGQVNVLEFSWDARA